MNVDDVIQQPGQRERLLKEAILGELHVALPGEVVSYDPSKGTVSVQPTIRNWKQSVSPPILRDVPVLRYGGIYGQIWKGTGCLVVFSDRCIDAWVQNGGVSNPISARQHDLSDGFAIVGFRVYGEGRHVLDELDNHEAWLNNHESRLDGHDSYFSGHDERLADHDRHLSEHDTHLGQHDNHLSEHDGQLEDHSSHLSDHDSHLSEHDGKLEALEGKISSLEEQLSGIASRLSAAEGTLSNHEGRISALEAG